MSTYKVLQDIEAEDKLLGPLTLKQCLFALIFAALGFIEFKLATTTALSIIRWPFVFVLIPPMAVFGFLAAPISRDQPNDIWLLARIRFIIKPHVRIWNQDGISELVSITVPKKIEELVTNGLDETEVQSRLSALANTLDSRGWAIKNVNVNMTSQPDYFAAAGSDRLVAPSGLPSTNIASDVHASDDIMDEGSNPTAQHLNEMVAAATAEHHKKVMESVQQNVKKATEPKAPKAKDAKDYWHLNQPSSAAQAAPATNNTSFHQATMPAPYPIAGTTSSQPTADEIALIKKIEADRAKNNMPNSHLKTLQPLHDLHAKPQQATLNTGTAQPLGQSVLPPVAPPIQPGDPASGTTPNPAILKLAHNDDLNVTTLARQAHRINESDGEVTISLH
jgi:hypothetical protein